MFKEKGLLVCNSAGQLIRSEVPRGSTLEHTLFHICINNLEKNTEWTLIKFADAKMGDASDLLKGRASIQRDLDMLQARAGKTF